MANEKHSNRRLRHVNATDVEADAEKLRHTRRLSDKILTAFHHACDQHDYEVAKDLVAVLEFMARRDVLKEERRTQATLVAAYERLWLLQHPDELDEP